MVYRLGQAWDNCLEPTDVKFVWDHPDFRSLRNLVSIYDVKQECLDIVAKSDLVNMMEFDPEHARLMSSSDGWKTIWLRYFGESVPRKISPELSQIVNHPIVYNASLSILEPGAEIPLHVGQCRALVKFHIPIYIPQGDVGMLYSGDKFYWTSPMIFDDTISHSVWNHTKERRIIILMDIIRPMGIPWDLINHRILRLAWWDPVVSERYKRICRGIK